MSEMWERYNPNPVGRNVGDCAVRAVAKALDIEWETAYALIANAGYLMGDMPSGDAVWGAVLRQHGFKKAILPDSCPDCYSARDFVLDHPRGVYVIAFGGHVAAVKNGVLYDSWDSSNEIPLYFWYEEEE